MQFLVRRPIQLMGLTVVVGLLLTYASSSQAIGIRNRSATESLRTPLTRGGQEWCEPLRVFLPSPGFRPLAASNAQLRANGFPPRPTSGDRRAFTLWRDVVSRARHFSVPHPICTSIKHTTYYSSIWAGHTVSKSSYGGSDIVATESEWAQPSIPANSNYTGCCVAPAASFWTGTGLDFIIQAGADSIATSTVQYRFWTEDYPQGTVYEGPALDGGDTVYVYEDYAGNNQGYYYLENVTTGKVQSFLNSAPDVGLGTADFINERLEFSNGGYYLPDFGLVYVYNNNFWQGSTKHQLSLTNDRWNMTSDCTSTGTVLSEPSGVSAGGFDQEWYDNSPYVNGCSATS